MPWIWSALTLNAIAAVLFLLPSTLRRPRLLIAACVMTFVGIWIEKGMGLIIPGFIPSTLGEVVEYHPTVTEWKIVAGIWAFGLLIYTALLKIALPILRKQPPVLPAAANANDGGHH